MMMISCAAMIIEMRTLYLKCLPKVLHQNENCQYCLVRPQCKKKTTPEGNESADEDDNEAVEINKKTIKKILKKNKQAKNTKKIQQKRSHSSDNSSSDLQEGSSSDDGNVSKKVNSSRYGKVAFYKVYKGPARYFPENN